MVSEAWISYNRLTMTLKFVPTSWTNASLDGFASSLVSTTALIPEDFGVALGFLSGDNDSNPGSSTNPLLLILSSNSHNSGLVSGSAPGARKHLNNISHCPCCLVWFSYSDNRTDPNSSTGMTKFVNTVFLFR
jgi:hypothetical protein